MDCKKSVIFSIHLNPVNLVLKGEVVDVDVISTKFIKSWLRRNWFSRSVNDDEDEK